MEVIAIAIFALALLNFIVSVSIKVSTRSVKRNKLDVDRYYDKIHRVFNLEEHTEENIDEVYSKRRKNGKYL
jgi:hypothetical protein